MAGKLEKFTIPGQEDWSDRLKEYVRDPSQLDKLGSSDLKRAGKMLVYTLNRMGERAAKAERELNKRNKVDDLGALKALDRITARNLELTGGRPPGWSYLYREACERLHEYSEFECKKTSKGFTILGVEQDGRKVDLYDYDYADLGVSQATIAARLMTVHLRQAFVPRETFE